MQQACQKHVQNPKTAPNPYGDMPADQKVAWSRDLSDLAGSLPDRELKLKQLQNAALDLAESKTAEAKAGQGEIKDLKQAYWGQVAKTAGWMGATLASLAVTGVLPNPVTAIVAVGTGGMCIRSIVKARGAAKELGAKVPQLESQVKLASQIAADANGCAPMIGAWDQLLKEEKKAA